MQNISWLEIITLLGCAQGLFLAFVLMSLQKGNRAANRFLALFILAFSLSIGGYVLYDNKFLLRYPHLTFTYNAFDFAIGPFIYFYIRALTREHFQWKKIYWLHFLPVLCGFIYKIPFYLKTADYKIDYLKKSYEAIPLEYYVFTILIIIQGGVYLFFSIKMLMEHSRNVKNYFSDVERKNLNWIRNFMIGVIIIWVSCSLATAIGYKESNITSNFLFTILVYWMGYKSMRQPEIFAGIREPIEQEEEVAVSAAAEEFPVSDTSKGVRHIDEEMILPQPPQETIQKKYERSELPPSIVENKITELKLLIEHDKIYLENELNLQMLSDKLSITNHHLSQLLNQHLNENFYDYINRHRVEEVKRELLNPQKKHLSILGVALDCGFNSKASFNAAFKKYAGVTPSEFRKTIIAD